MSRFIMSDAPQGTEEWKLVRAGKATGSRASDILSRIKSGEAAARRDYRVQIVTERLIGAPCEKTFVTQDMQHGTDTEPFARMAYEAATGNLVEEAGFAYLPHMEAGCSVDGFIDDDGILEIKCPKSATHVKYLLAGALPSEYAPQVRHNLFVTGRAWADFATFDPRMPEHLQLAVVRVHAKDMDLPGYEAELRKFLDECDALEIQLRNSPLAKAA